ncbi:UNVERIFIED_CONTAM: Lgmn [Trichonephila clavipes]
MIYVLSEAGMNLRRWATNSTTLYEAGNVQISVIGKHHKIQVFSIANNGENLTTGIVINHPNGNYVYKGIPKDYTGEDVTPKNFMAVLKGDEKTLAGVGSGKVRKSGPSDHVFVYFTDHGAPGLIAFPEDELSAMDLN